MNIRIIWDLLKETFAEWSQDKVSRLAAALAYYTVFSLAPLLIIVIAIAGSVFGEEAARGEIVGQIQGLVGKDGAEVIQTAIQNASKPAQGTIASVISIVVLLFGASGVFAELQDSLNTVWEVQPKPERGLLNVLRARFLSFSVVLGVGFLLIVSLVLSAVLAGISAFLGDTLPGLALFWGIANFIISFTITTVLFGLIYKVLPDVKITWNDVWIGAAITSLLFSVGRFLLGVYLGNSSFGSTYGAAGSLVIILAWVYYAAQILFLGAEFTQVYARRYGSGIVPDKNAMPLTEQARAEQGIESEKSENSRQSSGDRSAPNFISRLLRRFTKPKRSRRGRNNRQP